MSVSYAPSARDIRGQDSGQLKRRATRPASSPTADAAMAVLGRVQTGLDVVRRRVRPPARFE